MPTTSCAQLSIAKTVGFLLSMIDIISSILTGIHVCDQSRRLVLRSDVVKFGNDNDDDSNDDSETSLVSLSRSCTRSLTVPDAVVYAQEK